MHIEASTLAEIREHYRSIVTEALERAREIGADGLVFEFETLLEMTMSSEIGIELVRIMNGLCEEPSSSTVMSAIRLTPNDTRDYDRPPRMRTSRQLDAMWELFERGAGGRRPALHREHGRQGSPRRRTSDI